MLRSLQVRLGADSCHIARAKFSPVGENCRNHPPNFFGAKLEKPVTRSAREGIPQALGKLGIKSV